MFTEKQINRFKAKLRQADDGCIEFTGASSDGYGQVRVNNIRYQAHRLAWIMENGAIPDGMIVCHRCDNRRCVNVDHLFIGSQSDNIRDMQSKGRGLIGESAGASTITNSQAQSIVNAINLADRSSTGKNIKKGELQRIAKQHGVSVQIVRSISGRQSWTHVKPTNQQTNQPIRRTT